MRYAGNMEELRMLIIDHFQSADTESKLSPNVGCLGINLSAASGAINWASSRNALVFPEYYDG